MNEIKFRYLNEIGNMVFLTVWNVNPPLKKENLKKGTELMQFVGLKDKNKKEIYEGDIVKNNYGIFKIVWDKDTLCFTTEPDDYKDWANKNWYDIYNEVIGNIYENPELLEVKK